MRHALIFMLLFVACIGTAAAQSDRSREVFDRLREAHRSRNEAEIFHWTLQAAALKSGSIYRVNVGDHYWHGRGVTADPEQAVAWYRSAAELGSPLGMIGLARAHHLGRGAPRDADLAAHWLAMAADRGMSRANFGVAAHELSRAPTQGTFSQAADRIARGLEGEAYFARRSKFNPLARTNPIGAAYLSAGDEFACPEAAPRNWPLAVAFWLRAGLDGYRLGWHRLKHVGASTLTGRSPCFGIG